LNALDIQKL